MVRVGLGVMILIAMALTTSCSLLTQDVDLLSPAGPEFVGIETNLMAYYPFSGSVSDESRWGNDGALFTPYKVTKF